MRAGWHALLAAAALLGVPHAVRGAPPQTLDIHLAGRAVAVDIHRPAGVPRGAVVLSHGFTRGRTTLGGHAQALAAQGVLALAPDLPTTFDFEHNARGLAELVGRLRAGGEFGLPVERVVLVGFSAGALSSLLAAATPGVVGFVGLDAFDKTDPDRGTALGLDFARTLRTPVLLLRAPPSRCNAQSISAPWGAALPALVEDRVVDEASHCDFESPTDWVCRLACGGTDAARQAFVQDKLTTAIARWLPERRSIP